MEEAARACTPGLGVRPCVCVCARETGDGEGDGDGDGDGGVGTSSFGLTNGAPLVSVSSMILSITCALRGNEPNQIKSSRRASVARGSSAAATTTGLTAFSVGSHGTVAHVVTGQ
jgi:hypothetical protein